MDERGVPGSGSAGGSGDGSAKVVDASSPEFAGSAEGTPPETSWQGDLFNRQTGGAAANAVDQTLAMAGSDEAGGDVGVAARGKGTGGRRSGKPTSAPKTKLRDVFVNVLFYREDGGQDLPYVVGEALVQITDDTGKVLSQTAGPDGWFDLRDSKWQSQYSDGFVTTGDRLNVKIKMRHHDAWVLGGTANPPDVAAETGSFLGFWVLPAKGDLTVTVVLPQVAKLETIQSSPGNHDADIQAAVQNSGFGARPWYAGVDSHVQEQDKVDLTIYSYARSLRVTHTFQ